MIDLDNKRFGRLTVIKFSHRDIVVNKNNNTQYYYYYLCLCDCGKESLVEYHNLVNGGTKSCGCLKKEVDAKKLLTHGLSGTRLHKIWKGIRKRCSNNKWKQWKDYGGRGISLCKEWDNYINFYNWSINNGYEDTLTIDRIDNNGNYEPSNCRWVDNIQQANNSRRNITFEYLGEKITLINACRKYNLNYRCIHSRVKRGINPVDALNTGTISKFIEPKEYNKKVFATDV